uniref:Uncharacterized protein n=1 Tax=Triticum urartu TaxID=4572 RepID=A0A8R7QUQ5_TRIUA
MALPISAGDGLDYTLLALCSTRFLFTASRHLCKESHWDNDIIHVWRNRGFLLYSCLRRGPTNSWGNILGPHVAISGVEMYYVFSSPKPGRAL